ncbi:CcdB family protein [Enterobacter hormaechei]|uniref:CcdB family protein n=1 Tax=Enterobacter hormaechei TaxID=158836 RepID=UPI00227F35B0|nr:CcdB family protein [Enterobacter hormaechei]
MCFQFDVYRNPSDRTREYQPYFMIIQHDFYDDLSTRLIVPIRASPACQRRCLRFLSAL